MLRDHRTRPNTRLIFADLTDYREAAAVRKEFAGHVKPVDTIVQIKSFVDPDWLIEVEADDVVGDDIGWRGSTRPCTASE
jgi:hypothetical protein